MKKIAIYSLFCIFWPIICGSQWQNVRRFELQHEKCKALVVIQEDSGYTLGFEDRENRLILIHAQPDTLSLISDLLFSPTGEKVIIESHAEGHQLLTK